MDPMRRNIWPGAC